MTGARLAVGGSPPQATGGAAVPALAPPTHPQLRAIDRRLLGAIALRALGDRPLPPRPSGAGRAPDIDWSWQRRAACRDATTADSEALTEADSQTAARPLADYYCAVCPVVLACLTAGRATRATGVWGGVALGDGKLAPVQSPPVELVTEPREPRRPYALTNGFVPSATGMGSVGDQGEAVHSRRRILGSFCAPDPRVTHAEGR